MNRRFELLTVALLAAMFLTSAGCGEQTEGYVYVDNGSEDAIIVRVDGKRHARIGPGRSRKLTLPLGDRKFTIKVGNDVVYEQVHTLDYGDRPFRRPTYVLNPDNKNRYCKVTLTYGEEFTTDHRLEDLVSLISNKKDKAEEAGKTDEVTRLEWETNRHIAREYRDTMKHVVPFGDDAFFQVEDLGNILTPMPTVVYSKQRGEVTRRTLARMPPQLHDYIEEAAEVEEPTAEDLEQLKVAKQIAVSFVPFRN